MHKQVEYGVEQVRFIIVYCVKVSDFPFDFACFIVPCTSICFYVFLFYPVFFPPEAFRAFYV